MDKSDFLLFLLRLLGAGTSALAGIAALLTDGAFSKRTPSPTGRWKDFPLVKYRASSWGLTLLAIIVVAPLVQFVGDRVKDKKDDESQRQMVSQFKQDMSNSIESEKLQITTSVANTTQAAKNDISASVAATTSNSQREILNTFDAAYRRQLQASQRLIGLQEKLQVQTTGVFNQTRTNLEKNWRLLRPFGHWKAQLSILNIPIDNQDPSVSDWVSRVLKYARLPDKMGVPGLLAIPHDDQDPMLQSLIEPADLRAMLFSSRFTLEVPASEDHHVGYAAIKALGFDLEPQYANIMVHIDNTKTKVTSIDLLQIEMNCDQKVGSPALSNWIDLYGREGILELSGLAVKGRSVWFTLHYDDTNESRVLRLGCEKCSASNQNLSLARVLTKDELGEFPADYKESFPEEYDKVEQRLKNNLAAGSTANGATAKQ